MKMGSKILLGVILFLVVLSVSATFYKTVVLQDFDVEGVYIEFPTEDSSYVWFVYENEEYELELETSNYEEILAAVADEVGVPESELDPDFVDYLHTAHNEGEVLNVDEGEVPEDAEEASEEESETTEEMIAEDGTEATESNEEVTEESTEPEPTEPLTEEEI